MKSLRVEKNWSQEQLAHLSGLNVRTIQRIEKGDQVGLETLKSLAAVFEISVDDLKRVHKGENDLSQGEGNSDADDPVEAAKEKIQSIKGFYFFSAFLIANYLLFFLPNYNGGENLGSLVWGAIFFIAMIVIYAFAVFQPFGEKWEKKKLKQLLEDENE